jgi:hypothetical protein
MPSLVWLPFLLVVVFIVWIGLVLSQQRKPGDPQPREKPTVQSCTMKSPFMPLEADIVPSHASYSNKFNDIIGNASSGIVGQGIKQAVIPSDWIDPRYMPTEYDGAYWPSTQIMPDYLYPGGDPNRPLRPQLWNASWMQRQSS